MHPLASLKVPEGKVAIHWFEQSTFAVKDSKGTVAFVDPYFPTERPPEKFKYTTPPLDESTLPVDYVLLTHNHSDHTWWPSLKKIHQSFPKARYFGPKESADNIAKNTPIPATLVTVIKAGDVCRLGTMTATAVYAKAPEGDPKRNIPPPDVTHLGYVVKAGNFGLYFTGDVFNSFPDRDDLVEAVARLKPDVGFLTNHPTEGEFPYVDGSTKMAVRIGLKHAVPSHYACFVKRDYDPKAWAAKLPPNGPKPLIIPRNSHVLYPP